MSEMLWSAQACFSPFPIPHFPFSVSDSRIRTGNGEKEIGNGEGGSKLPHSKFGGSIVPLSGEDHENKSETLFDAYRAFFR
jgi:hypothetical protein